MYTDELSKENKDILYEFVRNQSLFSSKKINLDYFLPSFNGKIYDRLEMLVKLESLVQSGYLLESRRNVKTGESGILMKVEQYDDICEFGIKDRQTYEMLRADFLNRIRFDKFHEYLSKIFKFLLDNLKTIGVSVVTSLLTTYLYLKFFGKIP